MADAEETGPETGSEAPGAPVAEETFALEGHKLDEMGGAQVGRVVGRVVSQSTGMELLVARMGRFGHYCLVPGRDAVAVNGRVWVPYTRDQIRRAPRVAPDNPLDPESEQAALAHYGLS